ncbi:MAG: DUF86 domain-containing protein [Phycisphaerales bacterium]|nr:DUF86 domain-containing protein [Phycisphaerales bacterium]
MRPDAGDAALLLDMRNACDLVIRFVDGRTFDQYRTDPLLRSGVERQIEIVGEAARRISKAFRDAHPEIAWRPIVAQRHILAHEYGEVEDDLVWRVATTHIPALRALLDPLVPSPPPPSSSE